VIGQIELNCSEIFCSSVCCRPTKANNASCRIASKVLWYSI